MATIVLSNLHPVGFNLFADSETFVTDLSDVEMTQLNGGLLSSSSSTPLIFSIATITSPSVNDPTVA